MLQELEHPRLGLQGALQEGVRTHQGVDPRAQLWIGVGLDEVVVRARLEPFDDLLRLRLRGQQQNGELSLGSMGRTKKPADLDPRDARHHPVEHQHVRGGLIRKLFQNGRAVAEDLYIILAVENEPSPFGVERTVVDDPDVGSFRQGVLVGCLGCCTGTDQKPTFRGPGP